MGAHKSTLGIKAGLIALAIGCLPSIAQAIEWDVSGFIEPELQYFTQSPGPRATAPARGRHESNLSVSAELLADGYWNDDHSHIQFRPFVRVDGRDDERDHGDIRALYYEHVFEDFEVLVGADIVFWGVLEAVHLIDIINQTDLVESTDTEDKLGQPMVRFLTTQDWGQLSFYVLPYFRERQFVGPKGRPSSGLLIDEGQTAFEDGDGEKHVDFAIRYIKTIGDYDIGLSYFQGTSRDPALRRVLKPGVGPVLQPFYPQIRQAAIDAQAVLGAWLIKLEALHNHSLREDRTAVSYGIEYSFYGVWETDADLGIVAEHVYDDRKKSSPNPFNNDLFVALRLALNDEQDTTILAGGIVDLYNQSKSLSVEADRRIGNNIRASLEARILTDIAAGDPFKAFERDDLIQLRVARYF